jgi:hypothetical protein
MSELTNKLDELKESCLSDVDSMINGTFVTEGKVTSEKDLFDYAMTLAKNAFGDDVDTKKVQGIVDTAMKSSDGDFEKASGIVTGSFNEETESCESCEKDPCECDEITEGKVSSEKDLFDYAMAIAKKAFGDKVDTKKVQAIVDNAMKDSDGDFGKATGIVSGSFTEEVSEDCDKEITEGKMSEIADSISEYIDDGKNTKEIVALLTKEYKISPKVAEDFIKQVG